MKNNVALSHNCCSYCGQNKIITDERMGEAYCTHCGFVISENMISSDTEWRSFASDTRNKSRIGDHSSIAIHDMGLSTIIGRANQDVTGKPIPKVMANSFWRLRKQDNQIQKNTPRDKSLVEAFSEMNNLKNKLSLSDSIVESAAYAYRKAVERGLIKGRTIKTMAAACIYFACRDAEIPRTLNDVGKAIDVKRKPLSTGYRSLLIAFERTMPIPNPLKLVSRIANIARLSEKTKRDAIDLLKIEKELGGFAGKEPSALAAAALYIAGKYNGDIKSQRQISSAAGITGITIRNRIKGLTESIEKKYPGKVIS